MRKRSQKYKETASSFEKKKSKKANIQITRPSQTFEKEKKAPPPSTALILLRRKNFIKLYRPP